MIKGDSFGLRDRFAIDDRRQFWLPQFSNRLAIDHR